MKINFYSGEPALLAEIDGEKLVIVSDLHMGAPLINDFEAVKSILKTDCNRLLKIINHIRPSKMIIAGDVKELIGYPMSYRIVEFIQKCFAELSKFTEVLFILGNHDGGLGKIFDNKAIIYKKFLKIGNSNNKIIITHGHRKLSEKEIDKCSVLVSGHIHPGYKLAVGNSAVTIKAWFVSEISINKKVIHWVVIPAFSSLIEGIPLNLLSDYDLRKMSPFKFDFEIISKRYYLLDLTPIE